MKLCLVGVVFIAACSSDSSTTKTDAGNGSGSNTGGEVSLSCNSDADHRCTYYATIPQGAQTTDCMTPDTIVTACSTANVVATCSYNAGGTDQKITWYTGSANNTALKSFCDSVSGTFTAT